MFHIKKTSFLILIISMLAFFQHGNGQSKASTFLQDVRFGGSFGLSFGTYTYIQLAPIMYYNINDPWLVGLGVDYTYYRDNSYYPVIEGSIISIRLFSQYEFYPNLYGHIEAQRTYYPDVYNITPMPNDWIVDNMYFAGGGYRQWVSDRSYMYVQLLFNLERSDFAFGINPRIEIGFASGF